MSEATQSPEQAVAEAQAKPEPRNLVFDSLDEAKKNEPSDDPKARFRLYTVENLAKPGEKAYIYERNPTTAVGRAYIHFGVSPEVTEPKERGFSPSKLKSPEAIVAAVSEMTEETRAALLAQLGVKPIKKKADQVAA